MDKRFFFCSPRTDFHTAFKEILQLYFPEVEPTAIATADLQYLHNQQDSSNVIIEAFTEGQDEVRVCGVRLYGVLEVGCLERKGEVTLLPWEKSSSGERRILRLLLNQLLTHYLHISPSPWGVLRGIRPTKIVHRLLDRGLSACEIQGFLNRAYDVESTKANLVTEIALSQRDFLLSPDQARKSVSIYIGIPFCPSRCLYCSFPSFPIGGAGQQVEQFLDTLRHEITAVHNFLTKRQIEVQTIYVGGGTPTSLPNALFRQLLADIAQAFQGTAVQEYTIEAGRPDTITEDKLSTMREYGVSRISINPQSMRQKTLVAIGRSHRPEDVESVFWLARQFGFSSINMDIIAGLPGETPQDMSYTLERIAALMPDNLTVHTLAVKRGSVLKELSGFLRTETDIVRAMLGDCAQAAGEMGMIPYYLYRQKYMAGNMENIGYALPDKSCLYNISIMEERQTILGLGAAAATKAVYPGSWRLESCHNPKDVSTYINDYKLYLERKLALADRVWRNEEELTC